MIENNDNNIELETIDGVDTVREPKLINAVITDVKLSFTRTVIVLVQLALASIPAMIILTVIILMIFCTLSMFGIGVLSS